VSPPLGVILCWTLFAYSGLFGPCSVVRHYHQQQWRQHVESFSLWPDLITWLLQTNARMDKALNDVMNIESIQIVEHNIPFFVFVRLFDGQCIQEGIQYSMGCSVFKGVFTCILWVLRTFTFRLQFTRWWVFIGYCGYAESKVQSSFLISLSTIFLSFPSLSIVSFFRIVNQQRPVQTESPH
jgi:hypothetical protein